MPTRLLASTLPSGVLCTDINCYDSTRCAKSVLVITLHDFHKVEIAAVRGNAIETISVIDIRLAIQYIYVSADWNASKFSFFEVVIRERLS